MELPVFEMVINPDETSDVEVSFVALVDKPAIERNFMAFRDQSLQFAINEEKRIISGPAMVADQLIYRKDANGEYNVFFSPETVREIALKFFKKDYQKNLNLFHDPSLSLEGVTIFESFVSDQVRGIQPMKGFEDLPDGTWFISAKVDNDEVWNKIKSGEVRGFSVEGIFSFLKKGASVNRTNPDGSRYDDEKHNIMSQLKDLFAKFFGEPNTTPAPAPAPAPVQNHSVTAQLKDGTEVEADKLEPGGMLTVAGAPAPAGDHELMDGTVVSVGEGGVITAVKPVEAPEEEMNKPTDYSAQFTAYEQKLAGYEQAFTQHVEAYNALAAKFAQAEQKIANLIELVGKIVETPTADSVVDKGNFSSDKPSRTDKLRDLATTIHNLKKQ